MDQYGGAFKAIGKHEYITTENLVICWFEEKGLEFTGDKKTGEVMVRTGIIIGDGIIKSIERNEIKNGSKTLYLLPCGLRKLSRSEPLKPDYLVDGSKTIQEWVRDLGVMLNL